MTLEFNELNLHSEIMQAVEACGYTTPMPIQEAVIPVLLAGKDVIGQAQTGTGKTAAFALPMLNNIDPQSRDLQGLVLAPTRELALQVSEAMIQFGERRGIRVQAVYGGQAYGPQIRQLQRGAHVVVGTPGRMIDLLDRDILDLSAVRMVVLDEADEMLSMGFVEDIESILSRVPQERQTALFSATLPAEIRRLAENYLTDPQSIKIQSEQLTAENVEQRYYLVHRDEKTAALTRLIEMENITRALIFSRTRLGAGDLVTELNQRGYPAEVLSGDLTQEARERTLSRFRQNQIQMLVATDVAARGLDIDDISHVFNFDLPDDSEIYVHRIGRTARAGKKGIAISLVTPQERRRLVLIERFSRSSISRATLPTEQEIRQSREARLVEQMTRWLQRGRCKREHELVAALVEAGNDPLDVAAAALKLARGEERQRPIAPVTELQETPPNRYGDRSARPERFERADVRERREYPGGRLSSERKGNGRGDRAASRDASGGRNERSERRNVLSYPQVSHEPGMVRLSLSLGRDSGVRPNDIVGTIAHHADIPGYVIGKIRIEDSCTLVDVPEEFAQRVLEKTGEVRWRRTPINVTLAG